MNKPLKYFSELRDPRVEWAREHLLEEILAMTIAVVLSGVGVGTSSGAVARPNSSGSAL